MEGRFTEQLRSLDDGIAAILDPKRHVYCACWWEKGGQISVVRYPGPCAKCGLSDAEHEITPESRRWHIRHAIDLRDLQALIDGTATPQTLGISD